MFGVPPSLGWLGLYADVQSLNLVSKITTMWGAADYLSRLLAIVVILQCVALGLLFRTLKEKAVGGVAGSANVTALRAEIGQLGKRLTNFQELFRELTGRVDKLDDVSNQIFWIKEKIEPLLASSSHHDEYLTRLDGEIDALKARLGRVERESATAFGLMSQGSCRNILQSIVNEMNDLADGAYGGPNPPVINPHFVAEPSASDQFQILDDLAVKVVKASNLPISIPSHAGEFWWQPWTPGMPGTPSIENPAFGLAMRLRCDHHRIKDFLTGNYSRKP